MCIRDSYSSVRVEGSVVTNLSTIAYAGKRSDIYILPQPVSYTHLVGFVDVPLIAHRTAVVAVIIETGITIIGSALCSHCLLYTSCQLERDNTQALLHSGKLLL